MRIFCKPKSTSSPPSSSIITNNFIVSRITIINVVLKIVIIIPPSPHHRHQKSSYDNLFQTQSNGQNHAENHSEKNMLNLEMVRKTSFLIEFETWSTIAMVRQVYSWKKNKWPCHWLTVWFQPSSDDYTIIVFFCLGIIVIYWLGATVTLMTVLARLRCPIMLLLSEAAKKRTCIFRNYF